MPRAEIRGLLGTSVKSLDYSYTTHSGRLYMPAGCCCDMAGCIKLFSRIDPDVAFIQTFSGSEEDTAYARLPHGQWQAALKGRKCGPNNIDTEPQAGSLILSSK